VSLKSPRVLFHDYSGDGAVSCWEYQVARTVWLSIQSHIRVEMLPLAGLDSHCFCHLNVINAISCNYMLLPSLDG